MISRRDFVARTGTVLAAGCVPSFVHAATGATKAGSVDLSSGLSKDAFRSLLNENFYVSTSSDGVMVLRLADLQEHAAAQGEIPTDAFTLIFEGVPSPQLPDGLYTLEHGSAGNVLLRLEAAQAAPRRARYRAVCCLFA
jgi:hypothetical protein